VPRFPALAKVLAAVVALGLLLATLVLSAGQERRADRRDNIGERELVRVTGPTGESVELVAIVDTGASSSSLDEAIAEDLGFDLANAETVVVRSALGREERPVVTAGLQVAGRVLASQMTVNDRSELPTRALLGRQDLRGFQVDIGRRLLSEPGAPRSPSTLENLLARSPALSAVGLLALLPFAALTIVLLRVVVGLSTLGTFSPVLLAFGYTQAGVIAGVLLTVMLIGLGFIAQPVLRRARLPRVARLGIIVGIVATTLVALQELGGAQGAADTWGTALPVVITAVIVERLWETWDLDGATAALTDAGVTLAVALLVTALLLSPPIRALAEHVPVAFAVACTVWIWVAGSYRGLRMVEVARFRPAATAAHSAERAAV